MFRKTDPITSQKAAINLQASGKLSERRTQVYDLVAAHPGWTHGELAVQMYKDLPHLGMRCCAETPHKRLKELEALQMVFWRGIRKCRDSGHESRCWYVKRSMDQPILSSSGQDLSPSS